MSKIVYPVVLRSDQPKARQLKQAILSASAKTKTEILYAIGLMERDMIVSRRLEILDNQFETYALAIPNETKKLLSDLDVIHGRWTLLAFTNAPIFHDEAYQNACEAHSLTSPQRSA